MEEMDESTQRITVEEIPSEIPVTLQSETVPDPMSSPAMRRASSFFDFVELATVVILVVLLISTFLFRHSIVQGSSMDETLADGEHLLISDFAYTPKQGDIIVFDPSGEKYSTPIVKRVIAVAGQTVEMRDGVVYIDGVALDESDYVYYSQPDLRDHYSMRVIPEGYVFVLGDHRNVSLDSRDPSIGLVDVRTILGKVILRLTPISRFGAI